MKNFLQKILLLTIIVNFCSCGKKGALYLPSEVVKEESKTPKQN